MRVLIVGVGGIGSFLGSYLIKGGFDITFIARGKRYKDRQIEVSIPNYKILWILPMYLEKVNEER